MDQSLHRGQEVADLEGLHTQMEVLGVDHTQMEALEVDHTQMEVLEVDHIPTVADQEVHFEN